MTAPWVPDDCSMSTWWLLHNCLMTAPWLPEDCFMVIWWQLDDCLTIFFVKKVWVIKVKSRFFKAVHKIYQNHMYSQIFPGNQLLILDVVLDFFFLALHWTCSRGPWVPSAKLNSIPVQKKFLEKIWLYTSQTKMFDI